MSCEFSVFLSHGSYSTLIPSITNPLGMYCNIHLVDEGTDAL